MMLEFTFILADRYLFSSGILKTRDKSSKKRLSFPVLKLSSLNITCVCQEEIMDGFVVLPYNFSNPVHQRWSGSREKETPFLPFPISFHSYSVAQLFTDSHQIQIDCSCYSCPYLRMKVKDVLAGSHAISSKSRRVEPSNPIQKNSKCLLKKQ